MYEIYKNKTSYNMHIKHIIIISTLATFQQSYTLDMKWLIKNSACFHSAQPNYINIISGNIKVLCKISNVLKVEISDLIIIVSLFAS